MLTKTLIGSIRQALIAGRASSTVNPLIIRQLSSNQHAPTNPGLAETKHGRKETDDQFDQRYLAWFNKPDIDSWELRKGLADLHGMDLIPEPKIICAALEAARRLNDHSIAVRYLESLRWKSRFDKSIYPYLLQEIRPTLNKLGISTPEELNYDKPELTIEDPFFRE